MHLLDGEKSVFYFTEIQKVFLLKNEDVDTRTECIHTYCGNNV